MLVVRVNIKRKVHSDPDDSNAEDPPPQPSDSPGTTDTEDLKVCNWIVFPHHLLLICVFLAPQGAPDLTVMLRDSPHIFLG